MVTTQPQSQAVVKFNMFYKRLSFASIDNTKNLKTVECTSFLGQTSYFRLLNLISGPQISSKLSNGINDPRGLENKIYTKMKGRETFYGDHTVPFTSCSEIQYVV